MGSPKNDGSIARSTARQSRRGAMLVLCAFLLPVLLALASFAVNIAFMELCRTELRTATDSATRASGRTLALTGDENASRAAARDAGTKNSIAGQPLNLDDADFVFGRGTRPAITSRYTFTPGGAFPNAVRITAHGPNVPQLMPGLLGNTVYEPMQIATSTQTELDVALVLDRSGSMAYASNEPAVYPPFPVAALVGWDFCQSAPSPSRWRDLVLGVADFLDVLNSSPQQEAVALVTYSSTSTIDVDLTSDYASLNAALSNYTNAFCGGSTAIGLGVNDGVRALLDRGTDRKWASKVIVVMTDGIHNTGEGPVIPAQNAANGGIQVHTITFALEADQSLMQTVASVGGGKHFHAASGADLREVFRQIAQSLPTMLTE